MPPAPVQELTSRLVDFWSGQGAAVLPPPPGSLLHPLFEPQLFFRMLGPEPWSAAQVQRSFRPRFAFLGIDRFTVLGQSVTVVVKGPEEPAQGWVLDSLRAMGFELERRDVRFFDEIRQNPVLGLHGVGWRLVLDGVEAGWLSWVQRAGGQSLEPVSLLVHYDLERLAVLQQRVASLLDLRWSGALDYRALRLEEEEERQRQAIAHGRRTEVVVDDVVETARRVLDEGRMFAAFAAVHEGVREASLAGAREDDPVSTWQAALAGVVDSCARAWVDDRRARGFPLRGSGGRSGVVRRIGV